MLVKDIELTKIVVPPRLRQDYGDMDEFISSVKTYGLLQPIGLDKSNCELKYGGRRLEAFKRLGYKTIPCVMLDVGINEGLIQEYVENTHRKQFTDCEILDNLKLLRYTYDEMKKDDSSFSIGMFQEWGSVVCGVGTTKFKQLIHIMEHANEAQLTQLKDDKVSVNKLYTNLKQEPKPVIKKPKPKPSGPCRDWCPLLEEYHLYYVAELFGVDIMDPRIKELALYLRKNQQKE